MRAMRCASAQLQASSANTVPVRGGGLYLTARTRVVSPTGDEEYIPVLQADDPEDASLLQQAETIFEDDMEDPRTCVPSEREVVTQVVTDDIAAMKRRHGLMEATADRRNPNFGRPKRDKMVTVRGGGLYLKARDRIAGCVGSPSPRPDWTIDTYPEEIERGKYVIEQQGRGWLRAIPGQRLR